MHVRATNQAWRIDYSKFLMSSFPRSRLQFAFSSMSTSQVLRAYRTLYKQALISINYSRPSRYTLRDHLREGFRKGHRSDFDAARIKNTLQFLHGATYNTTLEHKVLMCLLHTWWWQKYQENIKPQTLKSRPKSQTEEVKIRRKTHDHFNHLIKMLNESMGMCIR